jgi:hypothetical protein
MKYDPEQYLWPPRPEIAIPPSQFHRCADYWAQFKRQGTCNVMQIDPDRRIKAMNRHRAAHKAWQPTEAHRRAFLTLRGGYYVVLAELLHSKVPGLRNINYVHDILVADDDYLVGVTFAARQRILYDLFKPSVRAMTGGHYVVDSCTWLAINYRNVDFVALFDSLTAPEDEGLVFKDPDAKLAFCASPSANSSWQRKCRRPGKTHPF